ncbi:MAG: hypothetical protein GEU92_21100 [Alphaproteobacteria bacterium]|nr:hypothetical protein [Alphaproteobacteria bacterium]
MKLLCWHSVDRGVGRSLGLAVERWLFFAEAKHVVKLYYGESRACPADDNKGMSAAGLKMLLSQCGFPGP